MPTSTDLPADRQADRAQFARTRRRRNLAIGLAVGALCLLFYAVTIVKLGPAILVRPL